MREARRSGAGQAKDAESSTPGPAGGECAAGKDLSFHKCLEEGESDKGLFPTNFASCTISQEEASLYSRTQSVFVDINNI